MIHRREMGPRNRGTGRAAGWRAWTRNEGGSVTVIVALSITGVIALLALAIDLAALFDARSEAQRAADSAALAGASAFLEYQQDYARGVAEDRAIEFATQNEIRGAAIAPEDVTVVVNTDSSTVTARVRRAGVATWFARLFGVDHVDIGAEATAWAGEAGAAQCLKPFAIPDMWYETTDDLNNNRVWDEGERWRFDPTRGDRYAPYSGPGGGPNETGYGSHWRDGQIDGFGRSYSADYGRRITIKATDPRQTIMPSFFLPWVLPPDAKQADCGAITRPGGGRGGGGGSGSGGSGGGDDDGQAGPGNGAGNGGGNGNGWFRWSERRGGLGGSNGGGNGGEGGGGQGGGETGGGTGGTGGETGGTGGSGSGGATERDSGSGRGAAQYRQNICSCNASLINFDTEYMIEPGNMVGPTHQGVQQIIGQDPDAYWDERANTVVSPYGMDSPRVVTVAVFDPAEISSPGRQYIRFNNFARIFIEEQASPQDPVTGRMLYYVRGVGAGNRSGATTGSLVRTLQLIR